MSDPSSKPPCPCCADRAAAGFLFSKPAALDGMCGECTEFVDAATADAILASILSTAPVKLRWNLSVAEIAGASAAIERRCKAHCDSVVSAHTSGAQLTWANTCGVLDQEDGEFSVLESIVTFPGHVSPDKSLRDACTQADTQLSTYSVESNARPDVYRAVLAYAETEEATSLTGERRRYLDRRLRDFRRVGLHLDEATSEKVKQINTQISTLGIQFSKNLGEEDSSFLLTAAELEGLPNDWLEERKQVDGTHKVTLKYPCYVPLQERCAVEATRCKMETAYNSRCLAQNSAILEELVELRHTKAQLMGYATHAEFVTEVRMSGGAEKVKTFLAELAARLTPLLDSDLEALRALKAADGAADPTIHAWDRSFYCKKLEETKYLVDHEELKKYFPLHAVTEGLLGIYQELLSLTFTRDPTLEAGAWHADVKAFQVTDAESKALVGFFYTDLHPRDGKYGHAACFGLQPACELGGVWQPPVAACVCNFPKPTTEKPALLSHRDVETYFHEFGHVMHQLCSKAKLTMFSGTRVERDFVEAPSQMLENWCWQPEALSRMSRHHATGAPLPAALQSAMITARNANAGILNMRQIVLGSFDQAIHTAPKADTAAELARISAQLLKVPVTPGTNMAANFGHLAGGYDAQYYGYMWSDVFSADMFESRFLKEGILSPATGKSYRTEILEPGGSRDALDSLKAFLGREPIQQPFLRSKGLAL